LLWTSVDTILTNQVREKRAILRFYHAIIFLFTCSGTVDA